MSEEYYENEEEDMVDIEFILYYDSITNDPLKQQPAIELFKDSKGKTWMVLKNPLHYPSLEE